MSHLRQTNHHLIPTVRNHAPVWLHGGRGERGISVSVYTSAHDEAITGLAPFTRLRRCGRIATTFVNNDEEPQYYVSSHFRQKAANGTGLLPERSVIRNL